MGTTGFEKMSHRIKDLTEIKKELQEERTLLLRDPCRVEKLRRRRNVKVMVSEFRALHYSQILGTNSIPFWSNKQLITLR
jgi:hypothetical protein